MWKLRSIFNLLLLCSAVALVAAQGSTKRTTKWLTLGGDAPLVIARGGFSGLFPDSSYNSYILAAGTSLRNVVMWCDVQLTKDRVGICFPDIKLENASNVDTLFKDRRSTYLVNGVSVQGWFPIDFNFKDLALVNLIQGVYSRSSRFDGTPQQILTVQEVFNQVKPPGLWLNVQHDSFYSQHNLSMRSFVLSVSRSVVINYISSPEVNFLRSIAARMNPRVTKLVFRFLGNDETEPSTNQTYGSLLQNLTFIKTFASGILVPKGYIWPVDKTSYLQPHTSIVLDAHKVGLEVYASDFASDVPSAYNYSYDPVAEYLSFIDNGDFSVDGVLSDFPITPSGAVDCYSHMGKDDKIQVPELMVISSDGASGTYPGCTDKAYIQAVSDGADVIDCTVQMTQDGIPFCMGSVNLIDGTDAAEKYSSLVSSISEIHTVDAIHSFDLNWTQIHDLKPSISVPFAKFRLFRNPKAKNDGQFMTLDDFLTFGKNASVSGVLITIENAAYLAEKQGLGVTDAVIEALDKAGYSNLTTKKVMIHSNDSAVLMKFVNSEYERVYGIKEEIRDIQNSTISEIKKFASSVIIGKQSVFPTDDEFVVRQTNVVAKLQDFKVKVFVQLFSNEFVSQAWDFFSDPYVEVLNYVYGSSGTPIDGVITGYPATANRFRRNRCLGYKDLPQYMLPIQPGSLFQLMVPQYLPPAEAPNPVLTESDVVEPPLPPVAKIPTPAAGSGASAGPTAAPSGQSSIAASIYTISMCILLAVLVIS